MPAGHHGPGNRPGCGGFQAGAEDALFLCIKGAVSDGHNFAAQVAAQGTKVIVCQDPVEVPGDVTVIQVEDSVMPWQSSRQPGTAIREIS